VDILLVKSPFILVGLNGVKETNRERTQKATVRGERMVRRYW
jgi:hypothetical protein